MANHHGSEGLVRVGAGANLVAEVTGFSFTVTAEYAEDTTLSDTAKTYNTIAITSCRVSTSTLYLVLKNAGSRGVSSSAAVTTPPRW